MPRSTRLLVVLAVSVLARTALAQQPNRKIEAEALFEQAKTFSAEGAYARACPLFAESQRLDPGLGTMLWLADCFESNGQTASAWAQFKEAAGAAALRRDPREKVARERAAQLEPRLARLVVRAVAGANAAPAVVGLELRRDGAVMTRGELGLELPMDAGPHTIEARAPGHEPWSTTVVVPRTPDVIGVDVPVLKIAPSQPTPTVPADGKPGRGPLRLTGLILGASGAALLGVGTFLAIDAKVTYDASNNNHCRPDNSCDTEGLNDRSTAQGLAAAATAGFAVGAAALVGGAIFYLMAPRGSTRPPPPAASITVAPVLGPRGGAVGVFAAW